MNKKKDNNLQGSASKPSVSPKTTPRQSFTQRTGKPLFKKQILAQINSPVAKKPTPVVITSQEEYFITDGSVYIKVRLK